MATIRQQIRIAAPARAVWNALTTGEGLAAWLAQEARIDPREGGRVVLGFAPVGDAPRVEEAGILSNVRPTRSLEWKIDSGPPTARGTSVAFTVGGEAGATKVHVVHSGSFGDDEAAVEAAEARWRDALPRLKAHVEG
jgi:uncharacterized protein YndB with AHSA1/START domain